MNTLGTIRAQERNNMLYELNDLLNQLESMELDPETFQDTLESMDFESQLADNSEWLAKAIKNRKARVELLKAEKKRITEEIEKENTWIDKYTNFMTDILNKAGLSRLDAGIFKYSFRKSVSTHITDENLIPQEYTKTTITLNKTEIKKAIQAGQEVPGAELVEKKGLQIR